MNKISVTGRLAADSEIRYTTNNDAVLQFRVADDVGYGDKKSTNWWQCSIFGKRAESLKQYLTKGQQVTVFGQVVLREYTDKDGQKRTSHEIRIDEVVLTGGKEDGRKEQPKGKTSQLAQMSDDAPF